MAVTRSWVAIAEGSDFPLENLPVGVFRRGDGAACVGSAIGEWIVDLRASADAGLLTGEVARTCREDSLNALMAMGRDASRELRTRLTELLSDAGARKRVEPLLVRQADVKMDLPTHIGDYTDFYASIYHATNVGRLFRPDNPLLPNYKYVPIGYHGRASSIIASGAGVRRPSGQRKLGSETVPSFGPSRSLDYELELGVFIGPGNALGEPIAIAEAADHVAGFCLLNDWSARDIQGWEAQPLGPFLGKSFATTISPWMVTPEALAPFRLAQA